MKLRWSALSELGQQKENQDAWGCRVAKDGTHFFVLSDGLGGHRGGAEASRLVVEEALRAFEQFSYPATEDLSLVVDAATERLHLVQSQRPQLANMRATIVALRVSDTSVDWLHCGDSRLYHLDKGEVRAQTRDHSVPQMLVSCEEISESEIRGHPDRNRLTRALGGREAKSKSTQMRMTSTPKAGEAFLLCSDGFWEVVTEPQLLACTHENPEQWLQSIQNTHRCALQQAQDNYTAVLVTVEDT